MAKDVWDVIDDLSKRYQRHTGLLNLLREHEVLHLPPVTVEYWTDEMHDLVQPDVVVEKKDG